MLFGVSAAGFGIYLCLRRLGFAATEELRHSGKMRSLDVFQREGLRRSLKLRPLLEMLKSS